MRIFRALVDEPVGIDHAKKGHLFKDAGHGIMDCVTQCDPKDTNGWLYNASDIGSELEVVTCRDGAIKWEDLASSTNPKDLVGATKPRLSLVPPAGLIYAALAMANGAEKYGPYNWREKKVQVMIYLEACMRHILSFQDGEENAKDSGVPHLAHALACLLIIIDAKETDSLIDNRPKPGAAAALIERYTKKAE